MVSESSPQEWIVSREDQGKRLDLFLTKKNPELSRSRISHLIDEAHVLVNKEPAERSYRIKLDDRIILTIPPLATTEILPENIPLDILFEDADMIVVNKAPGMLVHPVLHVSSGTLVNALLMHCKDLQGISGEMRPGIVHRLDRDTSGVIVAAKNEQAQRYLMDQFKSRKTRKTYWALVHGVPKSREGVIELSIGRSTKNRQKMAAFEKEGGSGDGRQTSARTREARTKYKVLRSSKD